jgi:excisionase family DNA binding protein
MLVIVYNFGMPRGIYSVKQAAEIFGISDSHCRRLLENGKIKGVKLGHDWVVTNLKYKRKRKPKGGQNNEKS